MKQYNTIMNELLKLIPGYEFKKPVKRYAGDYYTKSFKAKQQLITLLFAQAGGKDSLREIETSLRVHRNKRYHIGFSGVKRSTLSDAMNKRSYEIFEGIFYKPSDRCRSVTPGHKFKFKNPLYTLDATVIKLCLSIFPWAKFRKRKGAIMLHYLYDHSGSPAAFMTMTDGKHHEMRVAKSQDRLDFELLPDSIISVDKAYIDFEWLYSLHKRGVYFVSRAKDNMDYEVVGQHKRCGNKQIVRDDVIRLKGPLSSKKYPEALRLLAFIDPETDKYYEFLTNNFAFDAMTVADIYKACRQIELFFKWIKQNLKIKSFPGTTPTPSCPGYGLRCVTICF